MYLLDSDHLRSWIIFPGLRFSDLGRPLPRVSVQRPDQVSLELRLAVVDGVC
jgi:hypothetical protein